MIFKSCIIKGEYPPEWKKANAVPLYKKRQQTIVKLQTNLIAANRWENFEMTIYNNVFEYLTTKKLISDNQSGFKPGDSCVNQLLSITHEIYHSLDNGRKVRGVSLDTFKAFDKVWHVGLMFKSSDEISSNPKLFSYDTSLFSVVHDKNTSAKELNND